MGTISIIVIAAIVVLSILAVIVAEEPLDEVFHVKAAMQGFPLQPLATKVAPRPSTTCQTAAAKKSDPAKTTPAENIERNELKRLVPRSTVS